MAGAGVGAEIMDKGGAGAENKLFRLGNPANAHCIWAVILKWN